MLGKLKALTCAGRCHAFLDENALAIAALDSALQGAKTGALLLSESLTVRTRALLGKAAADARQQG